jgi:hypothetical protein
MNYSKLVNFEKRLTVIYYKRGEDLESGIEKRLTVIYYKRGEDLETGIGSKKKIFKQVQ